MVFRSVSEVYNFYKEKAIQVCTENKGNVVLKTDCHNESGIFGHSIPVIPCIKDLVSVYVSEIDQDVIDKALKNIGKDGWVVQQGDIRSLPYNSSFFDLILDFSTIDHVKPEELPLVIKEYKRVCKPKGKFVIVVWLSNKNERDETYDYQYYFEKNYFKDELKKEGMILSEYHLFSNNQRELWGFDGEWIGNT